MLEQVKIVRTPLPEEEGAVETTHDELTVVPVSHSRESEEEEKIGREVEKKVRVGESDLKFVFISHCPTLI